MEWTISCVEAQARPPAVSMSVKPGENIHIYVLADALEVDTGLRATVLRRAGEFPPAGALLLLELDLVESGNQPTFRVLRTQPGASTDWLRPDARTRLGAGALLRSGSRLEATLPHQRRVSFVLQASGESTASARAVVAGSGTRKSQALAADRGAAWLVPTIWKLLTDLTDAIIGNVLIYGRKLGFSTKTMIWTTTAWFAFSGAAIAFYMQRQATQEAEAQTGAVQEDLARAEAARAIALQAEQSCLVERTTLAGRLGDLDAAMALRAEAALGAPASQGIAVELGGARMGSAEILAYDQIALADLKAEVARRISTLPPAEVSPCLAQEPALGADLPAYLLVWHPDPNSSCPLAYGAVVDGTSLAGRWGLSSRVAREFGVPDPALEAALAQGDQDGDPRANDRWSALTLAGGARAVLTTLLQQGGPGRVPVAPSEAQIWALALFGAVNSLPTQADGVLDWTADACVGQLVGDLAASAPPAAPGAPLLPAIGEVASGEIEIVARPTPGCPWPADAVRKGADAALRAVARLAITPVDAPPAQASP